MRTVPGALRYYSEGLLASAAADFGVMPSLFEPSGLVREEFFSAGTPLVCSRTGGLSDRVQPYCEASCTGNGLFLEEQTHQAVLAALKTALRLAREPTHHAALRRHADAAQHAGAGQRRQAAYARGADYASAPARHEGECVRRDWDMKDVMDRSGV